MYTINGWYMKVIDRKSGKSEEIKYSKAVLFLYNTVFGRILLKVLTLRFVSKIVGCFMNTPLSCFMKKTISKSASFDMNEYEDINYNSYNKFFTRKYKKKYLVVDDDKNHFISPCDSNLLIVKLNKDSVFKVKGADYSLNTIINDDLNDYADGYLLIFRLAVQNYHRYCYIDNGNRSKYEHINGILHTVQPIAYDKTKVFHQNTREWCVLHTANFDDVIQVEVGALMVGKIVNNDLTTFKRGDEKGYFEFGGSTILLFVKNDVVDFDKDILKNSKNGNETKVKYGERIGIKK